MDGNQLKQNKEGCLEREVRGVENSGEIFGKGLKVIPHWQEAYMDVKKGDVVQ